MKNKINPHIDLNSICLNYSLDPSKVETVILDDQWSIEPNKNSSIDYYYSPLDSSISTASTQASSKSLDLNQALEDVDDIILKFRDRKDSVTLDQEGYKEIISIYGDIIRELTYFKDALYNKSKEEKYSKS